MSWVDSAARSWRIKTSRSDSPVANIPVTWLHDVRVRDEKPSTMRL